MRTVQYSDEYSRINAEKARVQGLIEKTEEDQRETDKKTASLDAFREKAEGNREEYIKAIKKGYSDEKEQSSAIDQLQFKKQDAKALIAKLEQRGSAMSTVASELTTLQGNLASFTAANQEYSETMLGLQRQLSMLTAAIEVRHCLCLVLLLPP